MKKKKIMWLVVSIVLVFLCYNFLWYFGGYRVYKNFQRGFPEVGESGVKIYVDEEEYQYSVNLPTYLMWDGNLAIVEKNFEQSFVIWLGYGGRPRKEGIMFMSESGETVQVELNNRTQALRLSDQEIVNENLDIIASLYDKAKTKWNLELE